MVRYFQGLFSASEEWQLDLSSLSFERIDSVEVAYLEISFLEDEILPALTEFNGDQFQV